MSQGTPAVLKSETFMSVPEIGHGFFTRHGGVSEGIYASLNCGLGSSDEPDKIKENRKRTAEILEIDLERLVTAHQVHGTEVRFVYGVKTGNTPSRADAMVTDRPGYALGILTADCAPVLLADPAAGVVAAAHAGWRGALDGVIETTIAAMARLGATPSSTIASVGPCIGAESYEVGSEFSRLFIENDARYTRFFRPASRSEHFLFDFSGFVLARLHAAGVGTVEKVGGDTLNDEQRYFSYRRACHRGESDYGRQLSAIALKD